MHRLLARALRQSVEIAGTPGPVCLLFGEFPDGNTAQTCRALAFVVVGAR
jgi:hypothetical protein